MADPSSDDLKALAEMRLGDAEVLLGAGRNSAAYYLAGYAVECGIKAVIAMSFRANVLPSLRFVQAIYKHDLVELLTLAGLKRDLDVAMAADVQLSANWAFASGWKETSRYERIDPFTANRMLAAVGDAEAGVLQWLKTRW